MMGRSSHCLVMKEMNSLRLVLMEKSNLYLVIKERYNQRLVCKPLLILKELHSFHLRESCNLLKKVKEESGNLYCWLSSEELRSHQR